MLRTWEQAKRLAKRIEKDDPKCHITGYRVYNSRSAYGIEVTDTRTGTPFVIDNPDQWDERMQEAKFYEEHNC